MAIILKNSIRCKLCGGEIESVDPGRLVLCRCRACGVDGGIDRLYRTGSDENYEEMSVWTTE